MVNSIENHKNSLLESNVQREENQCKHCENTFKSNTEKKAECADCDKVFKNRGYGCNKCDKGFKYQEKMRVKCKHCDKYFENNLRVSSLNICRGLFKKEEMLMNTINETECDIIGVSEVDIADFDEKKNHIVWKALEHSFHLKGLAQRQRECSVLSKKPLRQKREKI